MKGPVFNSTANIEENIFGEFKATNKVKPSEGTVQRSRPDSATVCSISQQEQQDMSSATKFLAPLPSKTRTIFKGKSVSNWSILRRRATRELSELWKKAVAAIDSPSFATYVYSLIEKMDQQIPQFRDVPQEDVFCGILQLFRDCLTGKNFEVMQGKRLTNIVDEIFNILLQEEALNFSDHKKILHIMYTNGLSPKFLNNVQ